jgi:hypothetical protein
MVAPSGIEPNRQAYETRLITRPEAIGCGKGT